MLAGVNALSNGNCQITRQSVNVCRCPAVIYKKVRDLYAASGKDVYNLKTQRRKGRRYTIITSS